MGSTSVSYRAATPPCISRCKKRAPAGYEPVCGRCPARFLHVLGSVVGGGAVCIVVGGRAISPQADTSVSAAVSGTHACCAALVWIARCKFCDSSLQQSNTVEQHLMPLLQLAPKFSKSDCVQPAGRQVVCASWHCVDGTALVV